MASHPRTLNIIQIIRTGDIHDILSEARRTVTDYESVTNRLPERVRELEADKLKDDSELAVVLIFNWKLLMAAIEERVKCVSQADLESGNGLALLSANLQGVLESQRLDEEMARLNERTRRVLQGAVLDTLIRRVAQPDPDPEGHGPH